MPRLLTLVPYGVVRTFAESDQLAVVEPLPALPFTPLGLMRPQHGGSAATHVPAEFLERFFDHCAVSSQDAPL